MRKTVLLQNLLILRGQVEEGFFRFLLQLREEFVSWVFIISLLLLMQMLFTVLGVQVIILPVIQ